MTKEEINQAKLATDEACENCMYGNSAPSKFYFCEECQVWKFKQMMKREGNE